MVLLDHFRPPLSARRHWHAFHNAWATYLSSDLNRQLPEGYFAEPNVQFGIQIDVATFEEADGNLGGSSSKAAPWQPPAPVLTIPFSLGTDVVEVLIYQNKAGPTLAGAIELVSPANKDRPENRDAFLAKCMTYVKSGIGLALVDAVTERGFNLHEEFLTRLGQPGTRLTGNLYAAAYRPIEREGRHQLDVWEQSLAIGQALPVLPLWLRGGICLRIELEKTYERTCQEQRVPLNGISKT